MLRCQNTRHLIALYIYIHVREPTSRSKDLIIHVLRPRRADRICSLAHIRSGPIRCAVDGVTCLLDSFLSLPSHQNPRWRTRGDGRAQSSDMRSARSDPTRLDLRGAVDFTFLTFLLQIFLSHGCGSNEIRVGTAL